MSSWPPRRARSGADAARTNSNSSESSSTPCSSAGADARLFPDRPLDRNIWAYFYKPTIKKTFSFAVDGSVKRPPMVPSGKGVVSAWSCYPHTLDLVDLPDEEIIKERRWPMWN